MGRLMDSLQAVAGADGGHHLLFATRPYRKLLSDDVHNINNNIHHHHHQVPPPHLAKTVAHNININVNHHHKNHVKNNNLLNSQSAKDYVTYFCWQCGRRQVLHLQEGELTVRALKSANGAEKSARDSPSSSFLIGLRGKTSSKVALLRLDNTHLDQVLQLLCGDCLQRKPLWSATSPASKSATSPAKSAAAAMECDSADDAKAGDAHADAETDAEADADAEGPPLPVRTDSLHNIEEEALLKAAPWYQAGIPREIALEILKEEPVGSFLVRKSTSKPGCFALSLRVPTSTSTTTTANYLILETGRGFKIKGFTKEFPSLSSLIVHHSVMAELLPCPLRLASDAAAAADTNNADNADFVDIDYTSHLAAKTASH